MLDKSCTEFIELLASKNPVPGGGGASAYAGSLGMALGSMVGNLTLGKKKYDSVQEDIKILLKKSEDIIHTLNELVEKDAKAFYPLSQAYSLPSGTEVEKKAKDEALQNALVEATLVPLKIAQVCKEAIDLHEEYALKGSRIAISDVGAGVILCKAALQGAKLNVLINTAIMKDEKLKEKILTQLEELEQAGLTKAEQIYSEIEQALRRT